MYPNQKMKIKKYDANEELRKTTTMPDPIRVYQSVRDIRKENYEEDKMLKDLRFTFNPEKR